jgi:hypothetical protein
MKSFVSTATFTVGVLLVAFSAAWSTLFASSDRWSQEQETELTELGNETRLLRFKIVEAQARPRMHSGQNPGELIVEHRKVREQYDKLKAEFEGVRDRPASTARALRWTGIALVSVAGLLLVASKDRD